MTTQELTKRRRLDDGSRREEILHAAVLLSLSLGYQKITQLSVAPVAECAPSLIRFYFGSMDGLRKAVMEHAVKNELAEIVLQGIIAGDPLALSAPAELKNKAKTILNFE